MTIRYKSKCGFNIEEFIPYSDVTSEERTQEHFLEFQNIGIGTVRVTNISEAR